MTSTAPPGSVDRSWSLLLHVLQHLILDLIKIMEHCLNLGALKRTHGQFLSHFIAMKLHRKLPCDKDAFLDLKL